MNGHTQYADDLALYALGSLEPEDAKRLEAHLAGCAECRSELADLQQTAGLLALSVSDAAPPQRMRQRFIAALEGQAPAESAPAPRGLRWWTWVPALAAVVVLAFVAVNFWQQSQSTEAQLQAAQRHAQELQATLQRNQKDFARAAEVMTLLTAPDAQQITLVAAGAVPQPQGKAIYSRQRGGLLFVASNFKSLPPNKAYELWLVPAEGAPIPAGVFTPDSRGSATVLLPPLPRGVQAKAFAITVEASEGAKTPTMPIILVGSAG